MLFTLRFFALHFAVRCFPISLILKLIKILLMHFWCSFQSLIFVSFWTTAPQQGKKAQKKWSRNVYTKSTMLTFQYFYSHPLKLWINGLQKGGRVTFHIYYGRGFLHPCVAIQVWYKVPWQGQILLLNLFSTICPATPRPLLTYQLIAI